MKARLQRSNQGKGSLTLYFNNDEQLQTLYERLVGAERAQLNGGNELQHQGDREPRRRDGRHV